MRVQTPDGPVEIPETEIQLDPNKAEQSGVIEVPLQQMKDLNPGAFNEEAMEAQEYMPSRTLLKRVRRANRETKQVSPTTAKQRAQRKKQRQNRKKGRR